MLGNIDRRRLLLAAAAMAAPVVVRAEGRGGEAQVGGYYDRLRGRLGDAGGGRFIATAEDLLLGEHNSFRAHQGPP